MKKNILAAVALAACTFGASASVIQNNIDASDLNGLNVTVAGETVDFVSLNAGTGSAQGSFWTLSIANASNGTFGDYDAAANVWYGLWSLVIDSSYKGSAITNFVMDGQAANVVFDQVVDDTNPGRPFAASATASATSSNVLSSGLAWDLNVSDFSLDAGETLSFVVDTDKIPEPSMLWLMTLGLAVLGFKKLSVK